MVMLYHSEGCTLVERCLIDVMSTNCVLQHAVLDQRNLLLPRSLAKIFEYWLLFEYGFASLVILVGFITSICVEELLSSTSNIR
jgi:hypothetical protein